MTGAPRLDTAEMYEVTEGTLGYWHYHISLKGNPAHALCGAQTMHTSLPINMFGVGRAAPEGAGIKGRWCEKCNRLAS